MSLVSAAPSEYTAPGVEEFWQPLFGTDGPLAITRPILLSVVATGLAGGRTGTRIVEELTEEAILNDFVRIGDFEFDYEEEV